MSTAEVTAAPTQDTWSDAWWLILLQGIASVIIGILLITDTGATLVTLIFFLGVYWFVSGIFDIVQIFLDKANWGWHLFGGVLGIIAGLVVMRHPLWASVLIPATLVWLLGIMGIVMGVIGLVMAFRGGGWGAGIAGVISIVFGLLLLVVSPFVSTVVMVALGAGWAIIGGIIAIVMAFRLRNA
jgi:uncharacterized membrane protein HdeD (DUF308 family)